MHSVVLAISHKHTFDFVHLLFSTPFQLLNNDIIPPTAYHDMVYALFKQNITPLYAKLYTHEMHKMHSLFPIGHPIAFHSFFQLPNFNSLNILAHSQHHFPFLT